jgi:flagellar assembly protein FliH
MATAVRTSNLRKGRVFEAIHVDFEAEARRVLDDALERVAAIEKDAYQKGFEHGEKAGQKLGYDQLVPVMEQFKQVITELESSREKMIEQMRPDILRLAHAIAEKVVKRVTEEDEQCAARVAKDAILQVVEKHSLVIYVSRSDFDLIQELMPEFLLMQGVKEYEIKIDPNVGPGGCIVETEVGTIDARIDTALAEVSTLVDEDGN